MTPTSPNQTYESFLTLATETLAWVAKQPKFKLKPQPISIDEAYQANNLMYIRFDGKIIKKPGGKKKIDGRRPAYSQLTEQKKYGKHAGRYYSLLMGREYQPGRYVMLLDIDNKTEGESLNGLQFMKLLNLDQYQAPKQSTPSGGFHYLFYVDEAQKDLIPNKTTMEYNGKIYNVDVKFKNQLCNCEPSKIDNYGEYKWLNPEKLASIPKLPEKLFALISSKPAPRQKMVANPLGNPTQGKTDNVCFSAGKNDDPKPTDPADARALCACLSLTRLNNYHDWIKVGLCLKRIGCPLSLWEEVSKRSKKNKPNDCSDKWCRMTANSLGIGSLHHWARNDSPELYQRIRPTLKSVSDIFADDQEHESIEIDTRYLVPKDGNYTKDQQTFKDAADLFETQDTKTLLIKSAYGTGKTYFLQQLMKKPQEYKRVLFITYRQTLARDIDRNFKALGFKNYLDGQDDPKVWNADRLIVQFDSLLKVMNTEENLLTGTFNGKYDMIVLDEIESLLMHMDGETMKGKEIQTFNFFDALLKLSRKVVCLDGDMSNRALSFMSTFGPFRYIKNNYQDTSKTLRIMLDQAKWDDNMRADIARFRAEDPNFKICICCQSATKAEELKKTLQQEHPDLNIFKLIGDDSSKTKKQTLEDINETMKDINVFIYSPVIESGVDITIQVKKIYGTLSARSNSQRAYLQMLARCRNVDEGEIPILNDPALKINSNFFFWTFKELEAMNREMVSSTAYKFEIVGDEIRQAAPEDEKRKTVSIYNETENLNKHESVFINYLRSLALRKGYGFEIDQAEQGDKIARPENAKVASILEAEDLDDEEFERLDHLKKMGKTTTEENRQVEKHYQQRLLETAELDEKQLKYFLNNRDALDYFLALLDLRNKWLADTRKDIHLVEKVGLAKDLIEALGFSSLIDDSRIELETFMMNFVMHVVDGTRFKNNRRINELFGLSRDSKPSMGMTAQRMVNWASRILKTFSLEVKLDKKTNEIHLGHLGDIVELVRRKNANGRYYEDEGKLLNLKQRPTQEFDTSMLDVDVFIDDDEVPQVQVVAPVPVPAPVRSSRVKASRFIPDFDW